MDTTQRSSIRNGIGPLHTNIPWSPTARARNVGLWPPPWKIQKMCSYTGSTNIKATSTDQCKYRFLGNRIWTTQRVMTRSPNAQVNAISDWFGSDAWTMYMAGLS